MAAICLAIAVSPLFILWGRQARSEKARLLDVVGWSLLPSCIAWGVIGVYYGRPPEVILVPIIATLLTLGFHELVTGFMPPVDTTDLPDPLAEALRDRNGATI